MSYNAQDWAWVVGDLEPRDRFVLLAVARHISNDTKQCWPGQQTLADLTGFSLSSIKRSIANLIDAGLLEVEQRNTLAGRQTNLYTVPKRHSDTWDKEPQVSERPLPEVSLTRGHYSEKVNESVRERQAAPASARSPGDDLHQAMEDIEQSAPPVDDQRTEASRQIEDLRNMGIINLPNQGDRMALLTLCLEIGVPEVVEIANRLRKANGRRVYVSQIEAEAAGMKPPNRDQMFTEVMAVIWTKYQWGSYVGKHSVSSLIETYGFEQVLRDFTTCQRRHGSVTKDWVNDMINPGPGQQRLQPAPPSDAVILDWWQDLCRKGAAS